MSTYSLHQFLSVLKHSGEGGFEGLVATCLTEITGQNFRIAKSGYQAGIDGLSDGVSCNLIAFEAKHYTKSKISAREIHGEISQLYQNDEKLDIYCLITLANLDPTDKKGLEEACERNGWSFLVIDDWRSSESLLMSLLANAPLAVEKFCLAYYADIKFLKISKELKALTKTLIYSKNIKFLKSALNTKILGFESFKKKLSTWQQEKFHSKKESMAIYSQDVAIQDPQKNYIHRDGVSQKLTQWYRKGDPETKILTVHAEEGMGKSWAIANWVYQQQNLNDAAIIYMPVSALNLNNPVSMIDIIIDFIFKIQLLDGNRGLIEKKIISWLADNKIIIVIDGLNEQSNVNWAILIQQIFSGVLNDNLHILVVDRVLHWQKIAITPELQTALIIEVPPYNNQELKKALQDANISSEDFPEAFNQLIRTPRYCGLAIEHYEALLTDGDFTIPRLIYEDMRSRKSKSLKYPLDHNNFNQIITDLAEKFSNGQRNIPIAELRHLLPIDTDPQQILNELKTSGVFLVGRRGEIKVEETRLQYGLGLLLYDDLSELNTTTTSDYENFISKWMEPHSGMDFKVSILSNTIFHAVNDVNIDNTLISACFKLWLSERNQTDKSLEALTNYIVRIPDVICDLAIWAWTDTEARAISRDFLTASYLNHCNNSNVKPLLEQSIKYWFSLVVNYSHKSKNQHVNEWNDQHLSKVEEIIGGNLNQENISNIHQDLKLVDYQINISNLRKVAWLIISHMKDINLGRFIDVYGLSTSLMSVSHVNDYDEAAWTIRMNFNDQEESLIQKAGECLNQGSKIYRDAANSILCRIATKKSTKIRMQNNLVPNRNEWLEHRKNNEVYSKKDGSWARLDIDQIWPYLGKTSNDPDKVVSFASSYLSHPPLWSPQKAHHLFEGILKAFDPEKFHASLDQSGVDRDIDNYIIFFSAIEPDNVDSFLKKFMEGIKYRNINTLKYFQYFLRKFAPILSQDNIQTINEIREKLSANSDKWASDGKSCDERHAESDYFLLSLCNMSPDERWMAFICRPDNAQNSLDIEEWFEAPSQNIKQQIIDTIINEDHEQKLSRALWYLSGLSVELDINLRDRLIELSSDSRWLIRGGVNKLACHLKDDILIKAIIKQERDYTQRTPYWEVVWGRELLLSNHHLVSLEQLTSCLPFPSLVQILEELKGGDEDIDLFANVLNTEIYKTIGASPPDCYPAYKTKSNTEKNIDHKTAQILYNEDVVNEVNVPTPPNDDLRDRFDPKKREENWELRFKKIQAALKTDSLSHYGVSFYYQGLSRLIKEDHPCVSNWVELALDSSENTRKLHSYLPTFVQALSKALLKNHDSRGKEIWDLLLQSTDLLSSNFDSLLDIACSAPDTSSTDMIKEIYNKCWTDKKLERISYFLIWHNNEDVLIDLVNADINSGLLWRKARGLTLAALSDFSTDKFIQFWDGADIKDTWVDHTSTTLYNYHLHNVWAKYWVSKFCEEPNKLKALSAWLVAENYIDNRFYLWWPDIRKKIRKKDKWKVHYLSNMEQSFQHKIDKNKKRKDTLYGHKVSNTVVHPLNG